MGKDRRWAVGKVRGCVRQEKVKGERLGKDRRWAVGKVRRCVRQEKVKGERSKVEGEREAYGGWRLEARKL
jgi:hypothetical protein